MVPRWRMALVGIVLAIAAWLQPGLPAAQRAAPGNTPKLLKVGFAERDITPELGMEVPGGYSKAYAKAIHDPCKVRAVVFDDGRRRVALVGVDGGFVYRDLVQQSRQLIRRQCGIPPEAVLIGASHSHSSGPLGIVQPGEYDHASEFVRRLAYEKSSCADANYLRRVRDQIVAAVRAADEARAEARCAVGMGVADHVAFNRRVRMKNGLTYTHPGQCNPESLTYAGPTDPTVGVLGAWDPSGKLLGCVVHFTCHATTSPPGISANYIYYLEKTIRGVLGPSAIVVFLQGDSGDVTQVDNFSPIQFPSGERWAEIVGGQIGAEAIKVLFSAEPGPLGPVETRSKVLQIPRRVPSPERVERCRELALKDPKEVGGTEWAFAKEIVLLDAQLAKSPRAEIEVQAIQIGPAVFVSNPGELFCQYGLELRAKSRFPYTFAVGYANGFCGYVPTLEAFGPHGGGYETRLTSASNLEPSAGSQINSTGLELIGTLTPGPAPKRPKVQPQKSWPAKPVPPELE